MSNSVGLSSRAYVGENTGWYSAWSDSDLYQIPIISETITKNINRFQDRVLNNSAGRAVGDRGGNTCTGDIVTELDYNNGMLLLEAGLGDASTVGGDTYYHLTSALDTILRFEIDKTNDVWRVPAFKTSQLQISGNYDETVTVTSSIIGRDRSDLGDDSLTGSENALSSRNPVNMTQGVVRIGAVGSALGDSDMFNVSSFTLSVQNALTDPTFATINSSHTNTYESLEPVRNDFIEVTLEITVPRYDADTLVDWKDGSTKLQADIIFTDDDTSEVISIFMPTVLVTSGFDAETSGPGLRELTGTFTCYRRDSSNDTMEIVDGETFDDEPVYIKVD